jgi:VWFA-related protein
MIRCHLSYALSVFCLVIAPGSRSSSLWAQQTQADPKPPAATPKLSVDARLVDLPVVVRDKKGTLIRNLAKTDFHLEVDGHPQEIRYFDIDSDLPLVLGLLVDTSVSQRSVIDEERSASATFLDHMLTTPKDQAFVMQFARQAELLGDLTNSRPKLQAALKEIDTPSMNSSPSDDSAGGSDSNDRHSSRRAHAGGTVLYDATFLASDELMKKQKGRKALIILSDGNDRGSKESLNKALESAQRANTILYAIYFKGEEPQQQNWGHSGGGRMPGGRGGGYPGGGYPGGRGGGGRGGNGDQPHVDGKKILKQLAEETGGRLFEVSKKQTVAQIYDQIAEELRAQYRLGYTPDQAASADGYHQVELTTNRKDLFVQTRDGYYGGKD